MVTIEIPEILVWILVSAVMFICILSVVEVYLNQKLVELEKELLDEVTAIKNQQPDSMY